MAGLNPSPLAPPDAGMAYLMRTQFFCRRADGGITEPRTVGQIFTELEHPHRVKVIDFADRHARNLGHRPRMRALPCTRALPSWWPARADRPADSAAVRGTVGQISTELEHPHAVKVIDFADRHTRNLGHRPRMRALPCTRALPSWWPASEPGRDGCSAL